MSEGGNDLGELGRRGSTTFNDLPLEILVLILECMDIRSYKSLILTSKLLCDAIMFTSFGKFYASIPSKVRRRSCFFVSSSKRFSNLIAYSIGSRSQSVVQRLVHHFVHGFQKKDDSTFVDSIQLDADERVHWMFLHCAYPYARPRSLHHYYFDGVYCVKSCKKSNDNHGHWRSIFDTDEGYVFALETSCKPGSLYSITVMENGAPLIRQEI